MAALLLVGRAWGPGPFPVVGGSAKPRAPSQSWGTIPSPPFSMSTSIFPHPKILPSGILEFLWISPFWPCSGTDMRTLASSLDIVTVPYLPLNSGQACLAQRLPQSQKNALGQVAQPY